MKAYLCFILSVLLGIALMAFCDAPFFAVHLVCLLAAVITFIASAAFRFRGVLWLATIGFFLCSVANGWLEYDSRRSVAVAATATLTLLVCIAMLVSSALIEPRRQESTVPEDKEEGDQGVFSRWFGR